MSGYGCWRMGGTFEAGVARRIDEIARGSRAFEKRTIGANRPSKVIYHYLGTGRGGSIRGIIGQNCVRLGNFSGGDIEAGGKARGIIATIYEKFETTTIKVTDSGHAHGRRGSHFPATV